MKRAAVLLAVYSGDKKAWVAEALNSIYAQSSPVDILVQCDGPISVSLQSFLAKEYNDGRLSFYEKRSENRGLAFTLNELIQISLERGYEYIFRMDADDVSLPNRVALQVQYLSEHPEVDALGGGIIEFLDSEQSDIQPVFYPATIQEIRRFARKRSPFAHVTVCFRPVFFVKYGFYNVKSPVEDYDLWLRAIENGALMANLRQELVSVRVDSAFYARRKDVKRAWELLKLKACYTWRNSLSWDGYFYAVAHFCVYMCPASLKRFLYKSLR